MEEAAETAGVSSVTVYKLARTDASFRAAYLLSREYNTDALEDRMARMGQHGNVAALFGTLRARRPEVWRDNVKVEHGFVTSADDLRAARERASLGVKQLVAPLPAPVTGNGCGDATPVPETEQPLRESH